MGVVSTLTMEQTANVTQIQHRPFEGEDDWWRVREFLLATYPITPPDFNWDVRRWDGNRFHDADFGLNDHHRTHYHLWETRDGKLAGLVHPDSAGFACLQLDPHYRHLIEADMIQWAEDNLSAHDDEYGGRHLHFFIYEYDLPRQMLLTERGYERMPYGGMIRRMRLGMRPLETPVIAEGYTLRGTRPDDPNEYQHTANVLNASFNRTFHQAADSAIFMTKSPSFRHDLNLVAEAPDGSFAAHVGVNYFPEINIGLFEPVCTHPDHRRKRLARSLMLEGLRRLELLGATDVYVGTGDAAAANHLYNNMGFTEGYKGYYWKKLFE